MLCRVRNVAVSDLPQAIVLGMMNLEWMELASTVADLLSMWSEKKGSKEIPAQFAIIVFSCSPM